MKLAQVSFSLAMLLGASAFGIPHFKHFEKFAIDSGLALAGLNGIALLNSATKYGGSCNPANVKIRRECKANALKIERRNYIAAVQCVLETDSILPPGQVPGAHSLFDDFVYVHMNSTMYIHNTGNFLIWHRYYIYEFEKRLHACGYKGALPYWEWGYDVDSPRDSPVFDGSDTSMGSDGEYIPGHPGLSLHIFGTDDVITAPPGTGGGCVFAGPFANMTVHLGPITEPDPTQDNPRCLKRDLNPDIAKRFTTFRNTTELILESENIEIFQRTLEGDARLVRNSLGVHGGGHFTIAGDPGADSFISPGDPAFYLHHSQVDRVYWIWQMLDFANRQDVFGTNTFYDFIPSPNTTVEDLIDLGPLAEPIKIKDLMNTVGGTPLCYVYL